MKLSLEKKILFYFFMVSLAIIVLGSITYRKANENVTNSDLISHRHEVLYKSQQVLSFAQDIETGMRGYLITGDSVFLECHTNAKNGVFNALQNMRQLTFSNPLHQASIDSLQHMIEYKLNHSLQVIETRNSIGYEAAAKLVSTRKGKDYMDEIRAIINSVQQAENILLVQHQKENMRSETAFAVTFSILVISGISFLIIAFLVIRNNFLQRSKAEEHIVIMNRDLEQRVKEKTKVVIETEKHLTTILDNMLEGVQIVSKDWRYLYINNAMVSIMKVPKEEALGRTIREIYPGIEETEVYQAYRRSMDEQVITESQLEYEYPDHSKRWFEIRIQPVEEGILVLAVDITEKRKANEDIKASEQLLAESQKVAQIGSWEWNIVENKITWSDALYGLYGLPPDEFEATYESFLKYAHPDDRDFVNDTVQQAFKDHKDFNFYYRIIKPDGVLRIIHGQGNVVVKNGEPIKMRGTGQDVTERRKAEEKIEQSEQLLAESQRMAHVGSWEWKIVENKLTWSDELYRIFGLIPGESEVTFETFLKYIHPDDRPFSNYRIQQVLKDQKDYNVYFRIIRPDGVVRILHMQGNVVVENGHTIIVRGVAQDVTERRRVEKKIEQSEQLLSESQQAAHIGSWEWDIVQNKIIWSDELHRIYGIKPNKFEATYEAFLQSAHPEDRELVSDAIQQAIKDHNNFSFYYRIIRSDGDIRIIHSQGNVVVKNEVSVIMRGVAQDVTERRKAEEEMMVQKKFTDAILNNMPADIAVFDKDHRYIFINQAAITNNETREWLIRKDDFDYCRYKGIDDTLAQKRRKVFNDALKTKADVEWIDEHQDQQGQTIYKLRKFHPQFENNDLTYVIGYGIDITEIKKIEIQLTGAIESTQKANAELDHFAYMVSHDLQEPLRMITGFLELLKLETEDILDMSAKEYIYFAVDGAERMKVLIKDLLHYSRVGTNEEDFSEIDLNEILVYATHVMHEDIQQNKVQVIVNQLPVIFANETLITQLFMNLISNAIKYRKKDNPEIEVGYSETAELYTFYVKDNGIGIEKEFLEQVFIIFKRAHTKSEYSGTGIGLAICKKIAEKHGGSIWVESETGKGSTFFFTIPKK